MPDTDVGQDSLWDLAVFTNSIGMGMGSGGTSMGAGMGVGDGMLG